MKNKAIDIILAEIGYGARNWGSELAPQCLVDKGVVDQLIKEGFDVNKIKKVTATFPSKNGADETKKYDTLVLDFLTNLYDEVYASVSNGKIPFTIGGDHTVVASTFSAVSHYNKCNKKKTGLVYIDTHPDINIPGDNPSGAIHGMTISMLLGIMGEGDFTKQKFKSLDPENLFYIATRDIDDTEIPRINDLKISNTTVADILEGNLEEIVDRIITYFDENNLSMYISFDADVMDSSIAPGVNYNPKETKGLTFDLAHVILKRLFSYKDICGFDIVENNPLKDIHDKTANLSLKILRNLLV